MSRTPLACLALLLLSLPAAASAGDAADAVIPSHAVAGSVCRRIVDPLQVRGLVGVEAPRPVRGCRLGKPVLLCEPATLPLGGVTGGSEPDTLYPLPLPLPEPPPAKSICYRLLCKGGATEESEVADPFGQRTVAVGAPALFCTPLRDPSPACEKDAECGAGSYCRRPTGQCGAPGVCAPRHVFCTADEEPVCGCDGYTYGNACETAWGSTSVAHEGACEGDVCPKLSAPVCGTDGLSYPSPCLAEAANATIAHAGVCP